MKKMYEKPEVEYILFSTQEDVTSMTGGVLDGSMGLEDADDSYWD